MAIGEVTGICRVCGEKFTIRKKFYKRKDLNRARKIYETDSPEEIERKIKAFWFPPYEGAYIEKDGEHFSVITNEMLMEIAEKMNNDK